MPAQDAKTLEFNECLKSDKMPYIINADLESMIKRIDECKNNLEKSSTTKIGEHIPCGYSIYTMYTEVKTMKKICESLREHAMEIINFEKKKMIPVTKEQREYFSVKYFSLQLSSVIYFYTKTEISIHDIYYNNY